MWLDNLKELKKASGLSAKQIADKTNLPEKTVVRIFSGDTDNPYVDTLRRIVAVLDGSLDDIFAEGIAVVGSKPLRALQEDYEAVRKDCEMLAAENAVLKDKVAVLTSENDQLRLKLAHKDELLALHNYYIGKLKD